MQAVPKVGRGSVGEAGQMDAAEATSHSRPTEAEQGAPSWKRSRVAAEQGNSGEGEARAFAYFKESL